MSGGNVLAAVLIFVCVYSGGLALIFWRKNATLRNTYLEIISEAAKVRDEAHEFLARARTLAKHAAIEQEFRVCKECGQIRSRFEAENNTCIECAAKPSIKR